MSAVSRLSRGKSGVAKICNELSGALRGAPLCLHSCLSGCAPLSGLRARASSGRPRSARNGSLRSPLLCHCGRPVRRGLRPRCIPGAGSEAAWARRAVLCHHHQPGARHPGVRNVVWPETSCLTHQAHERGQALDGYISRCLLQNRRTRMLLWRSSPTSEEAIRVSCSARQRSVAAPRL